MHDTEMGSRELGPLLRSFTIPMVLSAIIQSAYIFADRMIIGQFLGPVALGAATMAVPFLELCVVGGVWLSGGVMIHASQRLGAGEYRKVQGVLGTGLLLAAVTGLVVALTGMSVPRIFVGLLGGDSPEMRRLGAVYLGAYASGMLSLYLTQMAGVIVILSGRVRHYTLVASSGVLCNIILDLIFVYSLGWGIAGAAYATAASQTLTAVILLVLVARPVSQVRVSMRSFGIQKRDLGKIIVLGLPAFAQRVLPLLGIFFYTSAVLYYGQVRDMAILAVIDTVFVMLIIFPVAGFNEGLRPLIGYNFGAGKLSRVRGLMKYSLRGAGVYGSIVTIIMLVFPYSIMSVFGLAEADMSYAAYAFRLSMLAGFLLCLEMVAEAYFSATGQTLLAIAFSFMRNVVLMGFFLLIFPYYLGVVGVWLAFAATDFLMAVAVLLIASHNMKRKLDRI